MTRLRSIAILLITILFALCAKAENKEWAFHDLKPSEKRLFTNDVSNLGIQIGYDQMIADNMGTAKVIRASKDVCGFALSLTVKDTLSFSCIATLGSLDLIVTVTVMVDNSIKYTNKISEKTIIPINTRLDGTDNHKIEFFIEGAGCTNNFSVGKFEFSSHHYVLDLNRSIPPTCVEPGRNIYKCTDENCEAEYEELLPELGGEHNYDNSTTVIGSCLFPSATIGKCQNCGIVQYLDNDRKDDTLFQHDFKSNGECTRCHLILLEPDSVKDSVKHYSVHNVKEFLYLNEQLCANPDLLSSDITICDDITIPAGFNLQPIGSENHPFTGTIIGEIGTDGKKRTIKGVKFNENEYSDYTGFIGIAKGTPKKPVVISNLKIAPSDDDIVDENGNRSIVGKNYVGSFVGRAEYCDFNGCINMTPVSGLRHVGGIAGQAGMGCYFTDCINTATVQGTDTTTLGQIAGDTSIGYLMDCYASGELFHNSEPYTPITTESNFTNGMYAEMRDCSTVLPDSIAELLNQVARKSPVRTPIRDWRSARQNNTNWSDARSGSAYVVVSDSDTAHIEVSQNVSTYYSFDEYVNPFHEYFSISGGKAYRCDIKTTYTYDDGTKMTYTQNFDINYQNWQLRNINITKTDTEGISVSEQYECSADNSEITLTNRMTLYPNEEFSEETLYNDALMLTLECKVTDDNGNKRKVYYQYDPITHERKTLNPEDNISTPNPGTEENAESFFSKYNYDSQEYYYTESDIIQYIEYAYGSDMQSGVIYIHDNDDLYDEVYYVHIDRDPNFNFDLEKYKDIELDDYFKEGNKIPKATHYIAHTKDIPDDLLPSEEDEDHPTDISPVVPEMPTTALRKLPTLVLDLNGRVLKCTFDSEDPLYDLPQGLYIVNGRKIFETIKAFMQKQ